MIEPEYFRGRRVLVTGGGGFLGGAVCAALRASGAEVIAPRRSEADLTEQAAVRALVAQARPQVIIHLAAACGGIAANQARPAEFLVDNALMGLLLVDAARRAGVGRFVLISTTCAYPQDAPMPLREETLWHGPPNAITGPYGMAKRLLHEAIVQCHHQYGFDGITLIPTNLYGPGDHFDDATAHVIPALIKRFVEAAAAGAAEVVCWGTGEATRDFLYVADAARGILLATARHADPQPVNLASGVETPMRALAAAIAEATGFGGAIRWDATRPEGQPRRVLDTRRAASFGFTATTSLADGLRATVAWAQQRR
ncbi:MAG: NAD-dependent epimerase/dehydratase family protein [Myxococcales bacterium]|nr:NAD-dependent epimerase/dehydratase family protein [Myxococcales bacterium]